VRPRSFRLTWRTKGDGVDVLLMARKVQGAGHGRTVRNRPSGAAVSEWSRPPHAKVHADDVKQVDPGGDGQKEAENGRQQVQD
jgi:hypothetical protein